MGESVLIIAFMIASACTKEQEDEDDCRDVGGADNDDVHWLPRGVDREGRETTQNTVRRLLLQYQTTAAATGNGPVLPPNNTPPLPGPRCGL